jgi:catalase
MTNVFEQDPAKLDELSRQLIDGFDTLFGLHPGFRPVHAKGVMCAGVFIPSAEATQLTRAPHIQRPSTNVIVRFSNFGGLPHIPDADPNASPRGFAVRFYLGEHVHTDIIGHTHNGFPTRTGEEFLEFLQALNASGKDVPKPTPLDLFMDTHPVAKEFFSAPNPVPSSFARESYYAVSTFKFTNAEGLSCYGRFQIHPEAGNDYLDSTAVSQKAENFLFEEIENRIAYEPVKLKIIVEIAHSNDDINNATLTWPADRLKIEFGTIELTKLVSDEDLEARKIIFDPIPRVDGIEPSADPLFELRAAIYLMSGRRRRAAVSNTNSSQ